MHYLDSSALVKVLIAESESATLRGFLGAVPLVSSALVKTEVARAVLRHDARKLPNAARLLERVTCIGVDEEILRHAGRLDPSTLRTLDAIHLASALLLREELDAFVTYDARLLEAAGALGLPTASPGWAGDSGA